MKKNLLLFVLFISTINIAKANLWDLQLRFSAEDSSGLSSFAAATFIDSVFWTAVWNSEEIAVFDDNGSYLETFVIPGITGIRSFSWTGNEIYAANNTDTIFEINASSRTIVNKIYINNSVRYVTYDENANGGLGGFWAGRFNADINLYDLNGTVLNTIPEATHGYENIYSIALDNNTPNGPYLWVFHQGGTTQSQIDRYDIANNTRADIHFDVETDLAVGSSLAGGLFITNELVPGSFTIGGLTQSNPETVFAYELDEIGIVIKDGEINDGLTEYPLNHALISLELKTNYSNLSATMEDSLVMSIEVKNASNMTVYQEDKTVLNISANANQNIIFTNMNPVIGTYTATTTTVIDGNVYDVSSYNFKITEERMSRDDENLTGAYSINNGASSSEIVARYDLEIQDSLGVIHLDLNNPNLGDSTYGVIYSNNGGVPGTLIARTPAFIIGGASVDLWFNDTIILPAGSYFFGAYESANTGLRLATSANNYRDNVNFYINTSGTFSPSAVFSARAIHPIFNWDDANCSQVDASISISANTMYIDEIVLMSSVPNFQNPLNIVWKHNGAIIPGENDLTYNYTASTLGVQSFNIEFENAEGCVISKSVSVNVIEEISSIQTVEDQEVSIFPNPTLSFVNIDLENSTNSYNRIFVNDINGIELINKQINEIDNLTIDLSNFSKGIYVIHLKGVSKNSYHRIIVK